MFAIASVSTFAALPPNYESARRIKAVLEDKNLMEQMGWIETIQSLSGIEGYAVTSAGCTVTVEVKCGKMPGGIVGPCPLIVRSGKKQCMKPTDAE